LDLTQRDYYPGLYLLAPLPKREKEKKAVHRMYVLRLLHVHRMYVRKREHVHRTYVKRPF
jgi:hypothetical protein